MDGKGKPTMKDVAREAGVSLGTVSKVFNDIPVGEGYRLRVLEAAAKLNYQVNNYARGLKTNRTRCVALLLPSLRHPFFAQLADELTACLMRHDYRSLLMITNYDPEAEKKCFRMVEQNKVDGVIALTYSPDLAVDEDVPVVTIDRHFSNKVPCVASDNFAGGVLAAEKLMALGCKKLLFLRIGPQVSGEPDRRGEGFAQACDREAADWDRLLLKDREGSEGCCRFLAEHLHDGKLDYDGIFCCTDMLAVRVCNFLRDRGVDVPGQVQVIGYDGIPGYISGRYPCSTIVQPLAAMAEAAVSILLSPAEDRAVGTVLLPVRYAPGGTTREAPEL